MDLIFSNILFIYFYFKVFVYVTRVIPLNLCDIAYSATLRLFAQDMRKVNLFGNPLCIRHMQYQFTTYNLQTKNY